jgi:hypothetical protein
MSPDDWKNFYMNISTLPLESKSVFIRPLINTGLGFDAPPIFRVGFQWHTALFPMRDLVETFNSGMIQSYHDVIEIRY